MDVPTSLLRTRAGTIWAAGGHQNTAAIAEFDGEIWTRQTLPGTSTRVRPHVFHQSFEGDLWLGPDVGWEEVTGKGGIVQIHDVDGGTIPYRWTQHIPWESTSAYAIGETRDGVLWFGVGRLRRSDSQRWSQVSTPRGVTSWVHAILPTSVGDLWIGTRTYGAFQRTGDQWRQHSIDDGLISNLVQHLLETADGTIWAATGEGVHRYDGRSWQQYRAPMDGSLGWLGGLRQTAEGAVWLNQEAAGKYRTIRYLADRQEPETEITLSLETVSREGNTVVKWKGTDPWLDTYPEDLQYSWHLDGGEWSPYSPEREKVFFSLSSGGHSFEVRSRDLDFNVDASPATVRFDVAVPIWQEAWFIGMLSGLAGLIVLQTMRVLR